MLNPVGHPGCSFSTSLSKARYIRSVSSRCIYGPIHPWKYQWLWSFTGFAIDKCLWLSFYIQNPPKNTSQTEIYKKLSSIWSSAKINIIVESRALPTFAVSAWLFTLETNGLLPRVSRFWKTHESRTVHIQKSHIGSLKYHGKNEQKTPVRLCAKDIWKKIRPWSLVMFV